MPSYIRYIQRPVIILIANFFLPRFGPFPKFVKVYLINELCLPYLRFSSCPIFRQWC